MRAALRLAIATAGIVLATALPSSAVVGPGDAETQGTGVLPNFARDGAHLIRLLTGAFDPLEDALPAPSGIPLIDEASLPDGTAQYWLVQVRDDRFPEAAAAIEAAGGIVAGYVPDDTYMVRAAPAQIAEIDASDAVRWTGYYQPAWRMPPAVDGKPGLVELTGQQVYRVYVFASDPNPGAVADALRAMPAVGVRADGGRVIDVAGTAADLPAIAAIPGVEWISQRPTIVPANANARWVNDTGVRDVYSATAPGRLTGAGQTAAVADTGVNYTYDLNRKAHVAFRDCDPDGRNCKQAIYTQRNAGVSTASLTNVVNNATGHRKMVAYFDLGATGPNMYDPSSHGTHTAGSVTGDRFENGTWDGHDGLAPGAELVHQNIATPSGGLVLPGDIYQLFRQAYRPRNPADVPTSSTTTGNVTDYAKYRPLEDARTHNDSWGSIVRTVDTGNAQAVDRFVWDHEDMAIVFSAGNMGPGAATVASPTVAKSTLSSGASANGRQPMVSIDSMASFSSHGPTGDGRIRPDVATPGQVVVSSKGGTEDGYHVAQGTSMSAPVLTGLTTLVRQYFYDGYGPVSGDGFADGAASADRSHNPSAALVKATLVNGAERMRGFYTGDDGTVRALDGQWPSHGQGFGRVNLANSLYFEKDPTNNWYRDVWRGDAEAFPLSALPATRTYTLDVRGDAPLDVTLAYTDAPSLHPAGSPSLVNNLDLVVKAPDGTEYVGNNMNSRTEPSVAVAQTLPGAAAPDVRNPLERVRIAEPAAGTYTIAVKAGPIARGNQGFALAASGAIGSYTPGPGLQVDAPGSPAISAITVEASSADTAEIRFRTSEPTTAFAVVEIDGVQTRFVDSYNVGADGFRGLSEGTVETSAEYGNRPVVGTSHEILLTGLSASRTYSVQLVARDLAGNETSDAVSHTSPSAVFQADARDIGQLSSGATGLRDWRVGTQLYAGTSGGQLLGAFMFRAPGAFDASSITGAAVELTSAHDWMVRYTQDPLLSVDLLNDSVEASWGTQSYDEIATAAREARVYPETTHKRGGYQRYSFTFTCAELDDLRRTLANGAAAFRYESTAIGGTGIFSMDFGFNRRSGGPELRPRLVLFTKDQTGYPDGRKCDPSTPAPTISELGIHDGSTSDSVTVSWETDVDSTSVVLFREQGTSEWIQVGTPTLTKIHHVQVQGLDRKKKYEFAARSAACNGATTTDTNGGQGYSFFRTLGPPTVHASYDFETGDDGWTTETVDHQAPDQPVDTVWRHAAPGHESALGWHAKPYHDQNEAMLKAPPVTFSGTIAAVELSIAHDLEVIPPPFTTSDAVHVEYSTDGGANWTSVATFKGRNPSYPAFDRKRATFTAPAGEVRIRLRLNSDDNISSPIFEGASVDRISFVSYTPPAGMETSPTSGPAPAPSAGATGLEPPATRDYASPADIRAGTGICGTPDLTPTSLTFTSQKVRGGDKVTFSATVTNAGTAAANDIAVRFTDNGTQIGTVKTVARLAPGESASVSSDVWDTKQVPAGEHTITVTVDPANAIFELDETNNARSGTVVVQGNKIKNGSFETSTSGDSPDYWSSSGATSYADGGTDGERSVRAGPGGSWTSDPVAVEAGKRYGVSVAASGGGGTLLVEQLSATGVVVATLTTPLLPTGAFDTVTNTLTVADGVSHVRVVLLGGLSDVTTFDDVWLWEEA